MDARSGLQIPGNVWKKAVIMSIRNWLTGIRKLAAGLNGVRLPRRLAKRKSRLIPFGDVALTHFAATQWCEPLEDRTLLSSTQLVSVADQSILPESGASGSATTRFSMSADGRYVAFQSNADNLLPGDNNGQSDIFLRDALLGTTTRVSVDSTGAQGNSDSYSPSLSVDGSGKVYVAFSSYAGNLVSGDTNGTQDVFLWSSATATPKVNLSVDFTSGTEAGTTVIAVTATADSAVSGNQTVNLAVTGLNITAGDYSLSGTTITIPNGMASGSVTFVVKDDLLNEGNETATLMISNPSAGITLGTATTQNITITDDDNAGTRNYTLPAAGSFRIVYNNPNVEIYNSGNNLVTSFPWTADPLVINGTPGNDTFTIDFSGGNPVPSGGLTFHGGVGSTDNDALRVTGGSFATVTHTLTTTGPENSGNIVYETGSFTAAIRYDGLEPVDMSGSTITDLIFNLPAGGTGASLEDDGTSSNGISQLRNTSGSSFETTSFSNPSGSLTINRGNAADTITVAALPDFNATLTIGSAGSEFRTISFTGPVTLAANKNLYGNASSTISLVTSSSDLATSGNGTISLTTARNITLASGSSITTVNGGSTLSANQQATATTGNFSGIDVNGGVIQSTGSGAVNIQGRGGDDSSGNQYGVYVQGGGDIIGGTAGTVSVTGTGGASLGVANPGVVVYGVGTSITSDGGNVQVTGHGGNFGPFGSDFGVWVAFGGQITAVGSGRVTVAGTGGASTGGLNVGVYVQGSGSIITSGGGPVNVIGQGGGSGSSGFNFGVYLESGGQITAGGSGSVNIAGTGGSATGPGNFGVFVLDSGSTITSGGGSVAVTGVEGGGPSGYAIQVADSGKITTATSGGTITLVGNSMNFDSTAVISAQSGSSVTLFPSTSGVGINLGTATDPIGGPLSLTDAELDRITAGTLNIGNTNSGAMTFSADITRPASTIVNLTAAANKLIAFGTFSLNAGSGGDVTLTTSGTGGITTGNNTGTDITGNAITFNTGSGGIGTTTNFVRLAASSVTASTSGNAGINLVEADNVTIGTAGLKAGTGTVSLRDGIFTLGGDERICDDSILDVYAGATLRLSGFEETIGGLFGFGVIENESATNTTGQLTVANAGPVVRVDFTSRVTYVQAAPVLGLTPNIGDLVTGYFTYDPAAIDTDPGNPTRGIYQSGELEVSLNGSTIRSMGLMTAVVFDTGPPFNDLFGVAAGQNQNGSPLLLNGVPIDYGYVAIHFTQANGLLTSDKLPNPFPTNLLTISQFNIVDDRPRSPGAASPVIIYDNLQSIVASVIASGSTNSIFGGSLRNGNGAGTDGLLRVVKNGGGSLNLTGNSSYTGGTTVAKGTLLVDGSTAASNVTTVQSGATLGGHGLVNGPVSVQSGGSVAPGNSPGILNTGSVTFTAGSNFNVEINGYVAGTDYDQLNVTGTVDLGSATLNLSGSLGSMPSQQIVIINNDGADSVTGEFAGLPEGATISTNFLGSGLGATISYKGGTGNDVVIKTAGFTVSKTTTTTAEGSTNSFTVVLDTPPTSNVVIKISTGNPGVATTNMTTLTFTPVNWFVAQSVTVIGVDDTSGPATLTLSIIGNMSDDSFDNLPSQTVTAAVTNVAPTLSISATDINENGTTSLSGTLTDPGLLDAHGVDIKWGDPNDTLDAHFDLSAIFTINVATGVLTQQLFAGNTFNSTTEDSVLKIVSVNTTNGEIKFTVGHRYLDDGLSSLPPGGNGTASDVSTISVTVTDDDGGVNATPFGLLGSESLVNTISADFQLSPSVAMDSVGNYVVTWTGFGATQDGSGSGVYAQRFNASGAPVGPEFRVNTTTTDFQEDPAVAMSSTGTFVVIWTSRNQDGSGLGVYGQRYDSLGTAVGGEFLVNSTTNADQGYQSVAMDATGNFVVVWNSFAQDGSNWGVYSQRYNSNGVPIGGEFRVNSTTSGNQLSPAVDTDALGSNSRRQHRESA